MKKEVFKTAMVLFVGLCFVGVSGLLYAGTTVPDVIKMDTKGYKKHKKGIVEFTHKKHVAEYGATCGDCHHDDKGQPLKDLKAGDDVKPCIECHSKPGLKPKGRNAPKLTKKEELQYHGEALHENCKGCHKAYDKKNKTKKAPKTCKGCHPKKKK